MNSYTLKLFGRYFAFGWDKGEYFSLYTYKLQGEDEWVSFVAITWTSDPTMSRKGKVGWQIER